MPGTHQVHVGYISGTRLGTHQVHVGYTSGTCRVHIRYMSGTRQVHAGYTSGTCPMHKSSSCEQQVGVLKNKPNSKQQEEYILGYKSGTYQVHVGYTSGTCRVHIRYTSGTYQVHLGYMISGTKLGTLGQSYSTYLEQMEILT